MEDNKLHSVTVENQRKIIVSQVSEVDGISSECIKLTLVSGKKMVISGANLKMGAFSKQNGCFWAEGLIGEVKYVGAKTPFIKKILK